MKITEILDQMGLKYFLDRDGDALVPFGGGPNIHLVRQPSNLEVVASIGRIPGVEAPKLLDLQRRYPGKFGVSSEGEIITLQELPPEGISCDQLSWAIAVVLNLAEVVAGLASPQPGVN